MSTKELRLNRAGCSHARCSHVSDLTYIKTKEGWLYLVCVMDAFSKQEFLVSAIGETKRNQVIHFKLQQGKEYEAKSSITYNHFSF